MLKLDWGTNIAVIISKENIEHVRVDLSKFCSIHIFIFSCLQKVNIVSLLFHYQLILALPFIWKLHEILILGHKYLHILIL